MRSSRLGEPLFLRLHRAAGLLDERAFRETRDEARVQLDRERRLACLGGFRGRFE